MGRGLLLFTIILFAASLGGCKKARLNRDTSAARDHAMAQAVWNDIGNQVDGSARTSDVSGTRNFNKWNNCANVSVDTVIGLFPLTVTLDFGDANCKGLDGVERRGTLIYNISAPYRETGAQIVVTSDDYYVNDYRVQGSRTMKNIGKDDFGRTRFSVVVEDGLITRPDGKTTTWASKQERLWVEGEETQFFTLGSDSLILGINGILDDVYEITGTAEGTNADGRSFNVEITEALRAEINCRWITSGMLKITSYGLTNRLVDYGNGNCDRTIIVTIEDETYTLKIGD